MPVREKIGERSHRITASALAHSYLWVGCSTGKKGEEKGKGGNIFMNSFLFFFI